MSTSSYYIEKLGLQPHPEGGYYSETFRSETSLSFPGFDGSRQLSTSIYFLLEAPQVSSLHRIKSDEIWYYHDGGNLEIIELDEHGQEHVTLLGKDLDGGAALAVDAPAQGAVRARGGALAMGVGWPPARRQRCS